MQKKHKILLVGDSCTDTYIFGKCTRLSPEAPVPIFCESFRETRAGMAKNVLQNMLALDLDVDFITQVEEIKKTRIVSLLQMHHLLRIDDEPMVIKNISMSQINDVDVDQYDLCVISDYNKGFVTTQEIQYLCSAFVDKGKAVFVDSKKRDLSCFEGCIIKINAFEHSRVISFPKQCDIIITLGPQGAKYNDVIFPSFELDLDTTGISRDVCGAGDTFLAALVKMYLNTNGIEDSIPFSNYCAATVVNKFGVAIIDKKDAKKYEA